MHQIADAVDVEDDEILAVAVDHALELADHRAATFSDDALPVMRVRHRDGERVGGIVGSRVGLRQQHADHHAHLRLVAVAGADDALLHQVRRVFGDRHAGLRRHHHGDAARLAELERRRGILVDEGRLDRRFVGTELVEDAHQAVVDGKKPRRERIPIVGRRPSRSRGSRAGCRQSRPCPSRCGGAPDRCRECESGGSCRLSS